MKLGMIARADQGGLGTQTWEFWRHLRPSVTVVMNMGQHGRSAHDHERYTGEGVYSNDGTGLSTQNLLRLLDCDVVYSAETFYHDKFWLEARGRAVTVLQANPELYKHNIHNRPDQLWLPTPYARSRMPADAQDIPVPVALDRFQYRVRDEARTFVHLTAPAMADRNGTTTVTNALKYITEDCKLVIRGSGPFRLPVHKHVEVEFDRTPVDHYWEGWRDDYDVLLLPKRYAGLCLPVQEAAACGIPTVMLDCEPNDFYTSWRIPVETEPPATPVAMKGGYYEVYQARSPDLAEFVDGLVRKPELVREASLRAGLWARAYSWDRLLPLYERMLAQAAALMA